MGSNHSYSIYLCDWKCELIMFTYHYNLHKIVLRYRKIFMVLKINEISIYWSNYLTSFRYLPDSIRWLVSKGRTEEAMDIVRDIAKTNNKPIIDEYVDFIVNRVSIEPIRDEYALFIAHGVNDQLIIEEYVYFTFNKLNNEPIRDEYVRFVINSVRNEATRGGYFHFIVHRVKIGWKKGIL